MYSSSKTHVVCMQTVSESWRSTTPPAPPPSPPPPPQGDDPIRMETKEQSGQDFLTAVLRCHGKCSQSVWDHVVMFPSVSDSRPARLQFYLSGSELQLSEASFFKKQNKGRKISWYLWLFFSCAFLTDLQLFPQYMLYYSRNYSESNVKLH